MKKKILVGLLALCAICITSCKTNDSNSKTSDLQIIDEQKNNNSETEEKEKQTDFMINLYKIGNDGESIISEQIKVDQITEQVIWNLLKESEILEQDASIISFKKNNNFITLDVNEAFGKQLRSYGTFGETQLITCVVNTFLDTYNCDAIKITENGNTLESGHAIYEEPFKKITE